MKKVFVFLVLLLAASGCQQQVQIVAPEAIAEEKPDPRGLTGGQYKVGGKIGAKEVTFGYSCFYDENGRLQNYGESSPFVKIDGETIQYKWDDDIPYRPYLVNGKYVIVVGRRYPGDDSIGGLKLLVINPDGRYRYYKANWSGGQDEPRLIVGKEGGFLGVVFKYGTFRWLDLEVGDWSKPFTLYPVRASLKASKKAPVVVDAKQISERFLQISGGSEMDEAEWVTSGCPSDDSWTAGLDLKSDKVIHQSYLPPKKTC